MIVSYNFKFLIPKDLLFVESLLVICFVMSMKNSNRWDEILVWDWQRERTGITNRTGNGIGIKPDWAWQREWELEWTIGNGRGRIENDILAHLYFVLNNNQRCRSNLCPWIACCNTHWTAIFAVWCLDNMPSINQVSVLCSLFVGYWQQFCVGLSPT